MHEIVGRGTSICFETKPAVPIIEHFFAEARDFLKNPCFLSFKDEFPLEKTDLEEEKRKLMSAMFSKPGSDCVAFNHDNATCRRDAAVAFFALLALEAQGDVVAQQDTFWGPIRVNRSF